MHYDKAALDTFLKEESKDGLKPVDKLTIKRSGVAVMEGEVVVLSS